VSFRLLSVAAPDSKHPWFGREEGKRAQRDAKATRYEGLCDLGLVEEQPGTPKEKAAKRGCADPDRPNSRVRPQTMPIDL